MNKLKDEMIPLVKKTLQVGQRWFLQIVNSVDHEVSKTLRLMKEKQAALKEYMIDRKELLTYIEQKQKEVNYLKEKIEQASFAEESEKLEKLRADMDKKMSELLLYQQNYMKLEGKINKERRKIEELSIEKEKIQNDRNLLKSEYDHMQILIQESYLKTNKLEVELQSLQKQVEISTDGHELERLKKEYGEKKAEKDLLEKETSDLRIRFKALEHELIERIGEITRLNQSVQQITTDFQASMKQKEGLATLLEKTETSFKQIKEESIQFKNEVEVIKKEAKTYREKYLNSVNELTRSKDLLMKSEESFIDEMEKFEQKEKNLEEQLLQRQNELAIEKAKNGSPIKLSESERRILEREFEPRFAALYKESYFHPEFLSDFFQLTPSDRLKVEAAIVQLNYHYEVGVSKIRPNTVKTAHRSIMEYPFGQDRTGRIYFNKEKNTVQLYRISRTKNGKGSLSQDNVIEWLKKNQ